MSFYSHNNTFIQYCSADNSKPYEIRKVRDDNRIKDKSILTKRRNIVTNYIKSNPNCTYREIRRNTKVHIDRVFKNLAEAFQYADVPFTKALLKRNIKQQRKEVINYIRKNPLCTILDIADDVRVNVIRVFGSIEQAFDLAKVKYPSREVTSGVMGPFVCKRSYYFEKHIISLLNNIGKVEPNIRIVKEKETKIVDCILNLNNIKFVVEIKDYRGKNNITMYELKQLFEYMEYLNIDNGLMICPRSCFPKRKNSNIIKQEKKIIKIISENEIKKWGRREFP